MFSLHALLKKHVPAYKKWHSFELHTHVHGLLFVVVMFAAMITVYSSTQSMLAAENPQVVPAPAQITADSLLNQTLQLVNTYSQIAPDQQEPLKESIASLMKVRKNLLLKEAQSNPQRFLGHTVPTSIKKKLPAAVQQYVEDSVDVQGTYINAIAESKNGDQKEFSLVETGSGKTTATYVLQSNTSFKNIRTGSKVRVRGVKVDSTIVPTSAGAPLPSENNGVTVTSAAEVPAAGAPVPQKLLVLLVNFANKTTEPWSVDDVTNEIFNGTNSVNSFFQDSSYGQVSLTGEVHGWYTLPNTDDGDCVAAYSNWANAANQLATANGISVTSFPHRLYIFNSGGTSCGYSGYSYIGGSVSTLLGYNDASLASHELGHGFGLNHARAMFCGANQVDATGNCLVSEYGDPTDVMGNNWYHFNQYDAMHKASLGWLPSGQSQKISSNGSYTVGPLEASDGSTKLYYITTTSGRTYYVSYRQATGPFDATIPPEMTTGLNIHLSDSAYPSVSQSTIVDPTPGDNKIQAMSDGGVFQDSANGVKITQVSHNASGVTFQVQLGSTLPVCTAANPTVSLVPQSQNGVGNQALSYAISVANNDTSACTPSSFTLSSTGLPSGWIAQFTSSSVTVAPGASATANIMVTAPAGVQNGTYPFTVTAQDPIVASHGASATASYIVLIDQKTPTVTLTPQNGSALAGQTVTYTLGIKNNDGLTAGNSTFKVSLDGVTGWTSSLSQNSFTLAPAAQGSATITLASPTSFTGTQNFTLTITDTVNATHNTSISGTYVVVVPTVSVAVPKGGETWSISSGKTVTWTNTYVPDNASISIVARTNVLGDANLDGVIDDADYQLWFSHVGTQRGKAGYDPAEDFNNSGIVDAADFDIYYKNKGKSSEINLFSQPANIADFNADGVVDSLDSTILTAAWQTTPSTGAYNFVVDTDNNSKIDSFDLNTLAANFGKTVSKATVTNTGSATVYLPKLSIGVIKIGIKATVNSTPVSSWSNPVFTTQ